MPPFNPNRAKVWHAFRAHSHTRAMERRAAAHRVTKRPFRMEHFLEQQLGELDALMARVRRWYDRRGIVLHDESHGWRLVRGAAQVGDPRLVSPLGVYRAVDPRSLSRALPELQNILFGEMTHENRTTLRTVIRNALYPVVVEHRSGQPRVVGEHLSPVLFASHPDQYTWGYEQQGVAVDFVPCLYGRWLGMSPDARGRGHLNYAWTRMNVGDDFINILRMRRRRVHGCLRVLQRAGPFVRRYFEMLYGAELLTKIEEETDDDWSVTLQEQRLDLERDIFRLDQ